MDKKLVQKKLRGYQIYNEWEQREERKRLPRLTIQESVRQYLELQSLMRQIAPDAQPFFFEENLKHHVQTRQRFKRIARAMKSEPGR